MSDTCNLMIVRDRYNGVFVDGARGGAAWVGIKDPDEVLTVAELDKFFYYECTVRADLFARCCGPWGEDNEARDFWSSKPEWVITGGSPSAVAAQVGL